MNIEAGFVVRRLLGNIWKQTHRQIQNFPVQYQKAELYAKQYGVSDLKNLTNLISLNLIPPQFIHNFSSNEHFSMNMSLSVREPHFVL